jgi:hypothetical protein
LLIQELKKKKKKRNEIGGAVEGFHSPSWPQLRKSLLLSAVRIGLGLLPIKVCFSDISNGWALPFHQRLLSTSP